MALNITEPQVLLYYEGDAPEWHHRVLLRRLRDAVWVVLTPERDVQVENLADFTLLAFPRGAAVPSAAADNAHLFAGVLDGELPEHHAQATRLIDILGGGVPAGAIAGAPRATWRVADTSAAEFGTEVKGRPGRERRHRCHPRGC